MIVFFYLFSRSFKVEEILESPEPISPQIGTTTKWDLETYRLALQITYHKWIKNLFGIISKDYAMYFNKPKNNICCLLLVEEELYMLSPTKKRNGSESNLNLTKC